MEQFSDLTKAIGFAAANHSGEMVALLTRNGVVVPTETLNTKMLVALIVNALAESPSFAKDFSTWAANKASSSDNASADGDGSNFWAKAAKVSGEIFKAGSSYLQGRQQKATADALAAAEQAKVEAARLASETEEKSFASKLALSQASTTKVVVFGLLGLAVVGGAIWYFTRKK